MVTDRLAVRAAIRCRIPRAALSEDSPCMGRNAAVGIAAGGTAGRRNTPSKESPRPATPPAPDCADIRAPLGPLAEQTRGRRVWYTPVPGFAGGSRESPPAARQGIGRSPRAVNLLVESFPLGIEQGSLELAQPIVAADGEVFVPLPSRQASAVVGRPASLGKLVIVGQDYSAFAAGEVLLDWKENVPAWPMAPTRCPLYSDPWA